MSYPSGSALASGFFFEKKQETHVMRLDISVEIVISSLYKHTEYDMIIIFFFHSHIKILQNDISVKERVKYNKL